MDALSVKLFQTKGELSRSELRAALLEMQKCTSIALAEHTKFKLGGMHTALDEARHELEGFRQNQFRFEEDQARIVALEEDIRRRDEQIEFLMSVTEASNKYEWVHEQGGQQQPLSSPLPVGGGLQAVRQASEQVIDPVAQLEEMGFLLGEAVQALEASGGDLESALAILTPK